MSIQIFSKRFIFFSSGGQNWQRKEKRLGKIFAYRSETMHRLRLPKNEDRRSGKMVLSSRLVVRPASEKEKKGIWILCLPIQKLYSTWLLRIGSSETVLIAFRRLIVLLCWWSYYARQFVNLDPVQVTRFPIWNSKTDGDLHFRWVWRMNLPETFAPLSSSGCLLK